MGTVLSTSRMRLYFLGTTLSSIGDYALWLAAAVWVRELTGSTAKAGLCMLCLVVGTLLSPATGVLVDRVRRKPLLLVTNTLTGALVLTLTQVHGAGQVWLIYAVMFLYGLSTALSSSTMTALLPSLVPKDQLGPANGLSQALAQGQRLITPAIGLGLLAAYGGGAVALLDAASFAASVICWSFIRVDEAKPVPSGQRRRDEAMAGFRFLAATPVVRQLTTAMVIGLFVMGFFEILSLAVVTTGLHHAATWTGVIVTAMGVTGIDSGAGAGTVLNRIGPGRLAALGLALAGAASLAMAVPVDAVVISAALLFGLGVPFVVVGAMTSIQLNTPSELLGRVSGADNFLITAGQAVGIGAGATLVQVLSYRGLAYCAAALLITSAGYLASRPEQRSTARRATRTRAAESV